MQYLFGKLTKFPFSELQKFFKPGEILVEIPRNMVLIKNPQFLPNHYETHLKGAPQE